MKEYQSERKTDIEYVSSISFEFNNEWLDDDVLDEAKKDILGIFLSKFSAEYREHFKSIKKGKSFDEKIGILEQDFLNILGPDKFHDLRKEISALDHCHTKYEFVFGEVDFEDDEAFNQIYEAFYKKQSD